MFFLRCFRFILDGGLLASQSILIIFVVLFRFLQDKCIHFKCLSAKKVYLHGKIGNFPRSWTIHFVEINGFEFVGRHYWRCRLFVWSKVKRIALFLISQLDFHITLIEMNAYRPLPPVNKFYSLACDVSETQTPTQFPSRASLFGNFLWFQAPSFNKVASVESCAVEHLLHIKCIQIQLAVVLPSNELNSIYRTK